AHALVDGETGKRVDDLERAPHAQPRDAIWRRSSDVVRAVLHLPPTRTQAPADDVEQRRLAGAIRADDGVPLARRYAQIDPRQHLQTREIVVNVAQLECGRHRDSSTEVWRRRNSRCTGPPRPNKPTSPVCMNRIITTKRNPITNGQCSVVFASQFCSRMYAAVPRNGPKNAPVPPNSAMNTTSVPVWRSSAPGDTRRWKLANSAPATAAKVDANVNTISLVPNTL